MELFFDVSSKHKVMNANAPNYPTPLMHPNRILDEHDLIYIRMGEWEIGQGDETFLAREGDVLILSAGQSHYGVSPCRAGTGTMYIHALAHPTDAAAPHLPKISREGVLLQSHIPGGTGEFGGRGFHPFGIPGEILPDGLLEFVRYGGTDGENLRKAELTDYLNGGTVLIDATFF